MVDNNDDDGRDKECPVGRSGKDNSDSDAGGGGVGGGDHQTVIILVVRPSPFLRLERSKIRHAYRVYVVNK